MKIGISSPFELQLLVEYLYKKDKNAILAIRALGGTQPAQLAIHFLNMGHKVSIFTLSQDIAPNQYRVFHGDNLTIYIGHFRRNKMCVLDFQFKEIKLLRKMINFDKPDILSSQWTYEFALGGILSTTPCLITVRDWSPEILKLTKKPYRFMRMIMSFFVYNMGKKFIPNSPYIEKKIRFLKYKKLEIIPNGISDNLFLKDEKIFNEGNKIKLISINNGFGGIKNVQTLIRAFSKLLKKYGNLILYLIGDGFGINGDAYNWCKENDILDNILFIGRQNYKEVICYLDKSDLMVHPAKEESFGNILVEAMARKVPVIAGENSGAVPWVVKDSGILTNINVEDEIYKSVLYFIENPKALSDYSEKGFANVFSRFRLSRIASEYLNYFNEVLEK